MRVNNPGKALRLLAVLMYVVSAAILVGTLFAVAYDYGGVRLVAALVGVSVIVGYIQRHIIRGEPYVN